MSRQEIDPRFLQNAHLLGQQRPPTAAEKKAMQKEAITMAVMQVAGTAFSSILESGPAGLNVAEAEISLRVAKDILKKSEQSKDDYGEQIGKRKLRNQLAAQLIYSTLRGGSNYLSSTVDKAFDLATKIVDESEAYAENEIEEDAPSSDIIAT